MVRLSKPERKRSVSFKRPRIGGPKSKHAGQHIKRKTHANALTGDCAGHAFIPKIG